MAYDAKQVEELNNECSGKAPEDALKWALENVHPNIALASSFGAEDVVVIDMLMKISPEARVFSLDTGRLNQETYNVMDDVKNKYNLSLEVMFPETAETEAMVREHGMNLFYKGQENRKLCCGIRKVTPLKKILGTLDGWITGIRADQTQNRGDAAIFEVDNVFGGILKVNPIINWSWDETWDYIKANNVPYNKLHDKGYPSIGCEPCTRAIKEGEDLRAGRWWWENESDKEGGLHMDHSK